ncbi:thioesterase domain-containing protein [Micromonospora sp. NPDC005189]|uniref:thioesterase II family protein n=1 Tax=unclassified Micromonospora TaxID=2617518 RepID=UPI0033AF6F1C
MITGRSRSSDRWLRSSPGPAVPARRLVCLPHAGGTAQAYRTWQDGVPGDTGVYAVQYPGRQDRLREPPATSIEQLAGRRCVEGSTDVLNPPRSEVRSAGRVR